MNDTAAIAVGFEEAKIIMATEVIAIEVMVEMIAERENLTGGVGAIRREYELLISAMGQVPETGEHLESKSTFTFGEGLMKNYLALSFCLRYVRMPYKKSRRVDCVGYY